MELLEELSQKLCKKNINNYQVVFSEYANKLMNEYCLKVYDKKYPETILHFSSREEPRGFHPTQKPVALFEYLIKTYTNEGETVLDNCMGSGTTAIACINTNRNFIGFELDEKYWRIARGRVLDAMLDNPDFYKEDYKVTNPSEDFINDMREHCMVSLSEAKGRY